MLCSLEIGIDSKPISELKMYQCDFTLCVNKKYSDCELLRQSLWNADKISFHVCSFPSPWAELINAYALAIHFINVV